MATNVYMDASGRYYSGSGAKSSSDVQVLFPDADFVSQLSGAPKEFETARAAMITAKVTAGTHKKNLGWLFGLALGVVAAALGFGSGEAAAQATPYHALSAASNNATAVTSGAGAVWDFQAYNTTATLYYVRLYDVAGAPDCTTATGVIANYPVPASATGNGFTINYGKGKSYVNGLGFCITAGGADNNNTSAATGVTIDFDYGGNQR